MYFFVHLFPKAHFYSNLTLGACLFSLQLNVTTGLTSFHVKKDYNKIYMNSNTVNYAYFKSWIISSLLSSQVQTQQPIALWHHFSRRDPLCLSKVSTLSEAVFIRGIHFEFTMTLFTPQTRKPWLLRRWGALSSGNSAFSNNLHVSLGFFGG